MNIRDRKFLEAEERQRLAPVAVWSEEATRHRSPDRGSEADTRLAFQRDRDRILHSRAFRRLKHKTQVFVPHLADHQRTRLTHTLEVAQIGRSLARTLGLNEDLVEATALGHDLGHTAFGHTGEKVLDEILGGRNPDFDLGREVVAEAGAFKHNYQSLRVVDLLEWRYAEPGLNLTDQVREGILKHTSWKVDYPFPVVDETSLRLDRPCHLEGQVVAMADEIAQQTHDLEDGLRAGSTTLEAVEGLAAARHVMDRMGAGYQSESRRWLRQNMLIRGLIDLFISDATSTAEARIADLTDRLDIADHASFVERSGEISQSTIAFSKTVDEQFRELKAFIYQYVINHPHVNRQDWRARKVISALFRAYWKSPLNLPSYVLMRARDELGFPYLRDVPFAKVAAEIDERYHASAGFARLVADHVAGMSDRYALEEFRSLEQPSPEQRFMGESR